MCIDNHSTAWSSHEQPGNGADPDPAGTGRPVDRLGGLTPRWLGETLRGLFEAAGRTRHYEKLLPPEVDALCGAIALYVLRRAAGELPARASATGRRDAALDMAIELLGRHRLDPAAIPWPPGESR